jgi:hypothetical protein
MTPIQWRRKWQSERVHAEPTISGGAPRVIECELYPTRIPVWVTNPNATINQAT